MGDELKPNLCPTTPPKEAGKEPKSTFRIRLRNKADLLPTTVGAEKASQRSSNLAIIDHLGSAERPKERGLDPHAAHGM